ncbi:MAG: hypothetical protein OEM28_10470 [Nitrosopumilus sp.]|nr:hypothetical protein [Nitrosopumilus sp.]
MGDCLFFWRLLFFLFIYVLDDSQKDIFGSTFKRMSQERRVIVLNKIGMIDDETKSLFNDVKEIHRKYLHHYSKGMNDASNDALKIFEFTSKII